MALTPEEVVNKRFEVTKFRDGYDLDQVDDFLDQIVEELRQRDEEKAGLESQLAAAQRRIQELEAEAGSAAPAAGPSVAEQTIVVDAQPAPQPSYDGASAEATAMKSSAMLQLALELHDKYIREGEEQRDIALKEAEVQANRLLEDAKRQREDELQRLDVERKSINARISELREFETEYRRTLSSYIQAQLRDLEGSTEPKGAPQQLD